jgi:hypothetical protein
MLGMGVLLAPDRGAVVPLMILSLLLMGHVVMGGRVVGRVVHVLRVVMDHLLGARRLAR